MATKKHSTATVDHRAYRKTRRGYVTSEVPAALAGAYFLRVPMDGGKALRCDRAGMVYFLTPQPDRNPDSQSVRLLNQGFKKVALPEVQT